MSMKWFFPLFCAISLVFLSVFGISCVYGHLYPIKYSQEVSFASKKFGVGRDVIYSTINVESGFNKNAISSKGAVGLMQLLPSTAQDLAQRLNMEDFDLQNPQDNILLGTYYLSILKTRFSGWNETLCAYNAGPTNVSSWLAKTEFSEDGKTLKKIPFKETREYVLKFQKNLKYYSKKI